MKTLWIETISVIKVSLFWALALPAAAVICPLVAAWEKVSAPLSRGQSTSTGLFASRLRPASR
jgi:hypothetical protein